jgi:hypothetical protein
MTKHGDFCLSPENLMLALLALLQKRGGVGEP